MQITFLRRANDMKSDFSTKDIYLSDENLPAMKKRWEEKGESYQFQFLFRDYRSAYRDPFNGSTYRWYSLVPYVI